MIRLLEEIRKKNIGHNDAEPDILLLCPPPVGELHEFKQMFEGAREKSLGLVETYREVADEYGCYFFDTTEVAKSSDIDGIHWEKVSHKNLSDTLVKVIKDIFKNRSK